MRCIILGVIPLPVFCVLSLPFSSSVVAKLGAVSLLLSADALATLRSAGVALGDFATQAALPDLLRRWRWPDSIHCLSPAYKRYTCVASRHAYLCHISNGSDRCVCATAAAQGAVNFVCIVHFLPPVL